MTVSKILARRLTKFVLYLHTDVEINFEEATYSALEGEVREVCLVLTGQTDIDVSATVQVAPGTASMSEYYIVRYENSE